MKVAILGCGNGAYAAAVDLTTKGHSVTLVVAENHYQNLKGIEKTRTIKSTGVGPCGEIIIDRVTFDIESAVKECDILIPIAPSYAHEEMALSLVPFISDDQKILLAPGGTGGALVFAKIFKDNNVGNKARIAEFHTLPYVSRKTGFDSVQINLIVKKIYFACFPAKYNDEMYELVSQLYDGIDVFNDVLETGINNGNIVLHPAPVIMNVGKIEYYGKHYHYKEGITPSVAKVVQMIDDERRKVCRMFGYREIDVKQRLYDQGDSLLTDNVYDTIQSSEGILMPLEGPNDLNNRYLVEDTSISLVVVLSLAKVAGLELKTMQAIMTLADIIKSSDYMRTGRTLDKMGIDNMSIDRIREYLYEGR